MDNWQAIQNWLVFVPLVGGLAWYYMPRTQPITSHKVREQDSSSSTATRRKSERETKPRVEKKQTVLQKVEDSVTSTAGKNSTEQAQKKKLTNKQTSQPTPPAQAREQNEADDELDMSTRQFAQQMQKARQGQQLSGSSKNSEKRVKTVKQGSAMDKPSKSLVDHDVLPETITSSAGDVSDMLEPAAPGPKALRVTAPSQPAKEKTVRQPKKEEVETKKQRQNRLKVEERKLQREAEEKERKALEEKQRRTAREARGEPARNGVPVSRAPANSAWAAAPTTQSDPTAANVSSVGNDAPLLDTFDVESSSSSNGGPGASTGPSSVDHDVASEEEQLAQAMQQSVDESGWTTVAVPKKQKKKAGNDETSGTQTPSAAPALAPPAAKSAPAVVKSGAKPSGFQALEDQYTQRTDVDPNDASNWDA